MRLWIPNECYNINLKVDSEVNSEFFKFPKMYFLAFEMFLDKAFGHESSIVGMKRKLKRAKIN